MLISIVLTLQAQTAGTLPAEQGRANYAELLGRLEAVLPGEGARLHDAQGPKPLACSGLLDQSTGANVSVQRGSLLGVRVAGLTAEMNAILAEALLRHPPRQWRLGAVVFDVLRVTCDPALSEWAGQTSYDELWRRVEQYHDGRPALDAPITIEFASPTSFHCGDKHVPIPLPGLVFGSLVERWNAFAPVELDRDVRLAAENLLGISRYVLESREVPHRNGGRRVAGIGRVTYQPLGQAPADMYWFAIFHLLTDFAFYAGVGVQTASGMGQCRRLER